jgi:hypothetical protein
VLNRYKAFPKWARIAAPLTAALLALGACGSAGGDEPENASSTAPTTTEQMTVFVDIEAAAELVGSDAEAAGLSTSQTESMVRATCDAAGDEGGARMLAEHVTRVADDSISSTELRSLMAGLGDAAEAYCPEAVSEDPGLLNDAYAAGVPMLRSATTTTAAPATTTTASPKTTTTAAPPPPTTAPPPPPPTTAPPPPPPPPTNDVYYANCDAARAAGAAPVYRGDPGYRSGLDRDNDGVGCE